MVYFVTTIKFFSLFFFPLAGDIPTRLLVPNASSTFASVSYVAVPVEEAKDGPAHDYDEITDNDKVDVPKEAHNVAGALVTAPPDSNYYCGTPHLSEGEYQPHNAVRTLC